MPRAASPCENADPIARPSPRLCSPIPSAIKKERMRAFFRPLESPPMRSSAPSASIPTNATIDTPCQKLGSVCANSVASSHVPTAKKTSKPSVRDSTKFIPRALRRRMYGNQSIPSAIGTIPTYTPTNPKRIKSSLDGFGVSTATGTSDSKVPPSAVMRVMKWASSSTQG